MVHQQERYAEVWWFPILGLPLLQSFFVCIFTLFLSPSRAPERRVTCLSMLFDPGLCHFPWRRQFFGKVMEPI